METTIKTIQEQKTIQHDHNIPQVDNKDTQRNKIKEKNLDL